MVLLMEKQAVDVVPLRTVYLQEVREKGFLYAHAAMLREIKYRLAALPQYSRSRDKAISEAVRMHTRLIFMAAFDRCALPPVKEIDRLFIEVFGELSRPALTRRLQ